MNQGEGKYWLERPGQVETEVETFGSQGGQINCWYWGLSASKLGQRGLSPTRSEILSTTVILWSPLLLLQGDMQQP